jgi:hypothetical protein
VEKEPEILRDSLVFEVLHASTLRDQARNMLERAFERLSIWLSAAKDSDWGSDSGPC